MPNVEFYSHMSFAELIDNISIANFTEQDTISFDLLSYKLIWTITLPSVGDEEEAEYALYPWEEFLMHMSRLPEHLDIPIENKFRSYWRTRGLKVPEWNALNAIMEFFGETTWQSGPDPDSPMAFVINTLIENDCSDFYLAQIIAILALHGFVPNTDPHKAREQFYPIVEVIGGDREKLESLIGHDGFLKEIDYYLPEQQLTSKRWTPLEFAQQELLRRFPDPDHRIMQVISDMLKDGTTMEPWLQEVVDFNAHPDPRLRSRYSTLGITFIDWIMEQARKQPN